jgi:hypothetical protein
MKRLIYIALFIAVLGNLSHTGLPWWILVPVAAVAGWLFPVSPIRSFAAGFAGGFLLWYSNAFWLDWNNAGLLSGKISQIFQVPKGWHLVVVTGLLGGFLGGLGALTGYLAQEIFVGRTAKR